MDPKDIAGRKPVNKTAALVVSNGFSYQFNTNPLVPESEVPHPLREITETQTKSKGFADLTGLVQGRITVLGLSEKRRMWACRCSCGVYVLRSSKSLKKNKTHPDMCNQCDTLLERRRHYHWIKTGKDMERKDM